MEMIELRFVIERNRWGMRKLKGVGEVLRIGSRAASVVAVS